MHFPFWVNQTKFSRQSSRPTSAAEDVLNPPHLHPKDSSIDTDQLLLQVQFTQICRFSSAVALRGSVRMMLTYIGDFSRLKR